jgi:hypothetical protein
MGGPKLWPTSPRRPMPLIRCRRVFPRALLTLLVLTLPACASRSGGAASRRCVPDSVDPSYAPFGPVYTACEVDRAARRQPTSGLSAAERAEMMDAISRPGASGDRCASAEVEFVVNEEGRVITASARVIRSTDPSYAQSVMRGLPYLRFTPATKAGQPVRQVARHAPAVGATLVVVRSGSAPPARVPRPRC